MRQRSLAVLFVCVCGLGGVLTVQLLRAQSPDERPFAEIRRLSVHARSGLSASQAHDLGVALAHHNFAMELMQQVDMDAAILLLRVASVSEQPLSVVNQ